MKKLSLVVLFAVLLGCGHTQTTSAIGESAASVRTGKIQTTTTYYPDGRKEVVEVCEGCSEERSEGHSGSNKFYETLASVFSAIIGVGSIVLQAVK